MTAWGSGQKIGTALCEALGIDTTSVVSINLECRIGQAAHVLVTHLVPDDIDLKQILETYELRETPQ